MLDFLIGEYRGGVIKRHIAILLICRCRDRMVVGLQLPVQSRWRNGSGFFPAQMSNWRVFYWDTFSFSTTAPKWSHAKKIFL
jgi:hypothetical protein